MSKKIISQKISKLKQRAQIVGIILGGFLILLGSSLAVHASAYEREIYRNVFLGKLSLGGLAPDKAQRIISEQVKLFQENPPYLQWGDKNWPLSPQTIGLTYSAEKTAHLAYNIGRASSIILSIKEQVRTLFSRKELVASYQMNEVKLEEFINRALDEVEIAEQDAALKINEDLSVEVMPAKTGRKVDKKKLTKEINDRIATIDNSPVSVEADLVEPKVIDQNVLSAKVQTEEILGRQIELYYGSFSTTIDGQVIKNWLEFVAEKSNLTPSQDYVLAFHLNSEKIRAWVEALAPKIDQPARDAKLTIQDGKAAIFQLSQDGLKLNQEKVNQDIAAALSSKTTKIKLSVEVQKPVINSETIDTLGIKEKISSATTSFTKSPQNRIHNIQVGAQTLSGALIKPGEEFSVVKTLGEISARTGFLPELVIKEDRTIPEIGGGLCQVSTTLFRAALNAGLEITERTNHSYRVSYYEPPVGMDATIYLPKPDLKFKNDTPGYILIQAKVEGKNLTFEFYGTNDGRKVVLSQPQIYDIVQPDPPIYVETDELAKGETKQLEKAHPGSKAVFEYTVYDKYGSQIRQQTFRSSYTPWQARFLVGTREEQPPPEGESPPA